MRALRQAGLKVSSSIGRAAVSKTAGWGFEPLLACHFPSDISRFTEIKEFP